MLHDVHPGNFSTNEGNADIGGDIQPTWWNSVHDQRSIHPRHEQEPSALKLQLEFCAQQYGKRLKLLKLSCQIKTATGSDGKALTAGKVICSSCSEEHEDA